MLALLMPIALLGPVYPAVTGLAGPLFSQPTRNRVHRSESVGIAVTVSPMLTISEYALPPITLISAIEADHLKPPLSSGCGNDGVAKTRARLMPLSMAWGRNSL